MEGLFKNDPEQLLNALESKLTTDESFSKSRVLALLTEDVLSFLSSRFVLLRSKAKLNLLLSFIHMTNNNLEQWREYLNEIISVAIRDTDEWIQMIGLLLNNYPDSKKFDLSCVDDDDENGVSKNYQALLKSCKHLPVSIKNQKDDNPTVKTIVTRLSSQNTTSEKLSNAQSTPSGKKHYGARKRPKAFVERLECLQKAEMARVRVTRVDQSAENRCSDEQKMISKYRVPFPGRSHPFSNDDQLLVDEEQSQQSMSLARMTTRPSLTRPLLSLSSKDPHLAGDTKHHATSAGRKNPMVKMIEISETPQALRSQRRKSELEERAAKKVAKEELRKRKIEERANKEATKKTKAMDAATTVETLVESVKNTADEPSVTGAPSLVAVDQTQPNKADYAPDIAMPEALLPTSFRFDYTSAGLSSVKQKIEQNLAKMTRPPVSNVMVKSESIASISAQPRIVQIGKSAVAAPRFYRIEMCKPPPSPTPVVAIRPSSKIIRAPVSVWPNVSVAKSSEQVRLLKRPVVPMTTLKNAPSPAAFTVVSPKIIVPQPVPTKSVDEVFDCTNCLSPDDRARIEQFLRGAQNQAFYKGNDSLVLVKVDERVKEQLQPDGSKRLVQVETLCRMNYATGRMEKLINTKCLSRTVEE